MGQEELVMEVNVCVGSSCHLKGAHAVINKFQEALGEEAIQLKLGASFCQGRCTEGVIVAVNGVVYERVTPDDVPSLLEKHREGCGDVE